MRVRIASVVDDSIVDGPGFRLAVFFQGCPHHCPGCHNPDTHDPMGGYWAETDDILAMAQKNALLDGITLTGGEPLCQMEPCVELAKAAKAAGLTVMLFTGYLFEDVIADPAKAEVLPYVDWMVDGPFQLELRSLDLRFRGSKNQRVLDVAKSLAQGKAVEAPL